MPAEEMRTAFERVLRSNQETGFATFLDTNSFQAPIFNVGLPRIGSSTRPYSSWTPLDVIDYLEARTRRGEYDCNVNDMLAEMAHCYFGLLGNAVEEGKILVPGRVLTELRRHVKKFKDYFRQNDFDGKPVLFRNMRTKLQIVRALDDMLGRIPESQVVEYELGDEAVGHKSAIENEHGTSVDDHDAEIFLTAREYAHRNHQNAEIVTRDRHFSVLTMDHIYRRRDNTDLPFIRVRKPYCEFLNPGDTSKAKELSLRVIFIKPENILAR